MVSALLYWTWVDPTSGLKMLDSEVRRGSAMSCDQLDSALHPLQVYIVELDSKKYQVEVEIWRIPTKYIHVMRGR